MVIWPRNNDKHIIYCTSDDNADAGSVNKYGKTFSQAYIETKTPLTVHK